MSARRLLAVTALLLAVTLSTGAAAYPPRPRPTGTAVQHLPASSVVYLTGDSRVADVYLPVADGLTAQLGIRICGGPGVCNTPGHPTIINAARGGQRLVGGDSPTIPDLSAEWLNILGRTPRPTSIVVAIGINDFGRIDDDTWAQAYRAINTQAAAAGIPIVACTVLPLATWFSTYSWVTPRLLALNAWLRSYFGGPVCDMYATTVDPAGPWLPARNDQDGIHPNAAGVVRMAAAIPLQRLR